MPTTLEYINAFSFCGEFIADLLPSQWQRLVSFAAKMGRNCFAMQHRVALIREAPLPNAAGIIVGAVAYNNEAARQIARIMLVVRASLDALDKIKPLTSSMVRLGETAGTIYPLDRSYMQHRAVESRSAPLTVVSWLPSWLSPIAVKISQVVSSIFHEVFPPVVEILSACSEIKRAIEFDPMTQLEAALDLSTNFNSIYARVIELPDTIVSEITANATVVNHVLKFLNLDYDAGSLKERVNQASWWTQRVIRPAVEGIGNTVAHIGRQISHIFTGQTQPRALQYIQEVRIMSIRRPRLPISFAEWNLSKAERRRLYYTAE